jgi:hypothetical protein
MNLRGGGTTEVITGPNPAPLGDEGEIAMPRNAKRTVLAALTVASALVANAPALAGMLNGSQNGMLNGWHNGVWQNGMNMQGYGNGWHNGIWENGINMQGYHNGSTMQGYHNGLGRNGSSLQGSGNGLGRNEAGNGSFGDADDRALRIIGIELPVAR